jgi:hypothetical protein
MMDAALKELRKETRCRIYHELLIAERRRIVISLIFSSAKQRQMRNVEIKCQIDATDVFYCRSYYLFNMFQTPLCPSSGARECYRVGCSLWYLVLWFSSCRYGVELRVMCPVCGLLLYSLQMQMSWAILFLGKIFCTYCGKS